MILQCRIFLNVIFMTLLLSSVRVISFLFVTFSHLSAVIKFYSLQARFLPDVLQFGKMALTYQKLVEILWLKGVEG